MNIKYLFICLSASIFLTTAFLSQAQPEKNNHKKDMEQLLSKNIGLACTVEGPLTIKAIEKKEMENIRKSPQAPQVPFGFQNQDWQQFKRKYSKGSEIYFFTSSPESWEGLYGRQGYALIRNNTVIEIIITLMN